MRAHLPAAMALIAAMAPQGAAASGGETPGSVVTREEGGARGVRAVLPGRLVSYALPAAGEGRRIFLLVAPQEAGGADAEKVRPGREDPCVAGEADPPGTEAAGPMLLLRLDPSGSGTLESVRTDLPGGTGALEAIDADGDGMEDLVLARPGVVGMLRLDASGEPAGEPVTLLEDPEIDVRALDPRSVLAGPERGWPWAVAVLGGVRFYGATAGAKGWREAPSAELAVKVKRRAAGLQISAPTVRSVGRDAEGRFLFAAGPEPVGGGRLRTLLLDPARPESTSVAVWSRLPGPELVMESFFAILDGRPVLVVTTRPADKLRFLEEKALRVFPLDGTDRSRAGSPPILATESNANLWQQAFVSVADVDQDGRDDLVLAYYRGIKDDRIVLDTYTRGEDGAFGSSPRSTQFELEDADRSAIGYGDDLTGDGIADLILEAGGRMLIYEGSAEARRGKKLVSGEPRWSFPSRGAWRTSVVNITLGAEDPFFSEQEPAGPSRLVDVDGDGLPEILSIGTEKGGRSVFSLIFLGGPAAS